MIGPEDTTPATHIHVHIHMRLSVHFFGYMSGKVSLGINDYVSSQKMLNFTRFLSLEWQLNNHGKGNMFVTVLQLPD